MIQTVAKQAAEQVSQAIVGREQVILWSLAAILSKGHILLEDIPGVGKTTLAVALAQTLGLQFGRVQFTSDVMPADVVGYCVPENGKTVYKSGPVMCNLFLADELNRATSRTQSALLEAMEENQVTVDGVCHKLPKPFVVIATQNPLGAAGTQPLPDSLMDRFALRLQVGYPKVEDERKRILDCENQPRPVLTAEEIVQLQQQTERTYLSEAVADYGVRLMGATRKTPALLRGGSPRATLSVMALAKAWARLQGRDFVIPEDVQAAFLQGVPHRVLARGNANACLRRIVKWVQLPRMPK